MTRDEVLTKSVEVAGKASIPAGIGLKAGESAGILQIATWSDVAAIVSVVAGTLLIIERLIKLYSGFKYGRRTND